MACARLPGSILLKKILDGSCGAVKDQIVCGITFDAFPCSTTLVLSSLAPANVSHLCLYSVIFRVKMSVRSDRLCFLVGHRMLVSQRSICGEHTMATVSTSENLCMADLR